MNTRMTISNYKTHMHWLGTLLAIASLFFVGIKLFQQFSLVEAHAWITQSLLFAALGLSLFYCSNLLVLAKAWQLLMLAEQQSINSTTAIKIYGQSQLAKYIPGNIIQFASRQLMGSNHGFSQKALLTTSFWELGLIATAGLIVGALFIALVAEHTLLTIGLCVVALISLVIMRLKVGLSHQVKALLLYSVFHLFSGLIFVAILCFLPDQLRLDSPTLLIAIGAYTIAWLVGFLTPGAPGGLGVRELVLYTLLGAMFSESTVLLALVASRLVTVFGDVWFYLFTHMQVSQ